MRFKKNSAKEWSIDQAQRLDVDHPFDAWSAPQDHKPEAQSPNNAPTPYTAVPMALMASGVNVALDESGDLQNAQTSAGTAQDADDNDIGWAALPSAFATRLSSL